MKTPFDYLKRAPRFRGFRRLRPSEKARSGDRYAFLCLVKHSEYADAPLWTTRFDDNDTGIMQVGRSLQDSLAAWKQERPLADWGPFDGILYRPTK